MFRAPPMLLPHESTIGTGPASGLVTSESTRGIAFGEPLPEIIDNAPTLSPTEDKRGSTLSLEISKAEKKADDQRKISTHESKKQRVFITKASVIMIVIYCCDVKHLCN